MTTHTAGNKIYKGVGTTIKSPMGRTNKKKLITGRMAAENHKQRITLMPSRTIENKAKLTEKRLSIA